MIKTRVWICSSSRGKSLSTFWVVKNDAPFDSRIFLSAALLRFIRRMVVLKHAWLISFIELDAAPEYVSSFKIYGPSLLAQRGTEGKSIQRKIQYTWATKAQHCYYFILQKTQSIMVQIDLPPWNFFHFDQNVWILRGETQTRK